MTCGCQRGIFIYLCQNEHHDSSRLPILQDHSRKQTRSIAPRVGGRFDPSNCKTSHCAKSAIRPLPPSAITSLPRTYAKIHWTSAIFRALANHVTPGSLGRLLDRSMEYLKQNALNLIVVVLMALQATYVTTLHDWPIDQSTHAALLVLAKDDPTALAIINQYGDTITRAECKTLLVKLKEHQRKATP